MKVIVCCNGNVFPGKGRAPGLGSPSLPHLCDGKAAGSLVPICFLFRDLELLFFLISPLFLRGCDLRVFELQPTQMRFLSAASAFGGAFPCPRPEQHRGSAPAGVLLWPFSSPPGWAWWSCLPWQLLRPAGLQLGMQSVPPAPPGLGVQLCPTACQRAPCCATGCAEIPVSSISPAMPQHDAALQPRVPAEAQAGWAALASIPRVPGLARPLLRGCLSLPRAAPGEAAPCWEVRRGWEWCLECSST